MTPCLRGSCPSDVKSSRGVGVLSLAFDHHIGATSGEACHVGLSEFLNVAFRGFSPTSHAASIADGHYPTRQLTELQKFTAKETNMKEWLKPEITESEAGMEVTSYLPAELDRA